MGLWTRDSRPWHSLSGDRANRLRETNCASDGHPGRSRSGTLPFSRFPKTTETAQQHRPSNQPRIRAHEPHHHYPRPCESARRMNSAANHRFRQGLDTVEIARMERLLQQTPSDNLHGLFTKTELQDAGQGAQQAAKLAARFAAKEACCKLFPRETAL